MMNDAVWRQIRARLDELARGAHVKVGVLSGKGAEKEVGEGFSQGQVAVAQEYGVPERNIPERPFIRGTFEKEQAALAAVATKAGAGVMSGRLSNGRALDLLGGWGAGAVKKYIARGAPIPPPLAASTIEARRRRGAYSTRPLADRGHLLNSINHEVVT